MWSILELPAETDDGAVLWPEYWPKEKLDAQRYALGEALYKCMYLGRPEGLSGEVFKSHWFRLCRIRTTPGGAASIVLPSSGDSLEEKVYALSELVVYQFWDLAISAKESADYTVGLTLALHPDTREHIVLDVARGHWSFHETQVAMSRQAETWQPMLVGIENIAYQAAAVQEARQHLPFPVAEVKVTRDKVTRSQLPAQLAANGQLWVARHAWTDAFLDEVLSFPNGRHDDVVDALSGACALAQAYVKSEMMLF